MKNDEFENEIFGRRYALRDAANNIVAYQTGKKKIVTFHHEHMNLMEQSGMIGKICFHGARPSHGKTHDLERLKEHLSKQENVVVLHHNMELTPQSEILRELKKKTKRTTKDILSTPFTDAEKDLVSDILKRNGIYGKEVSNEILSETVSTTQYDPETYEKFIRYWLYMVDIKEAKDGVTYNRVLVFDHLSVYDSKETMDKVIRVQNKLKLEFNNIGFYNYFQISRQYEIDCMKNPILPNSSHIYMTDALQQYADIVSVGVIPRVMSIEKFAVIPANMADHLLNHIDPTYDGNEDKVRLNGVNRYYQLYIKVRDQQVNEQYPLLYCSIINKKLEETLKKKEFNNAVEYEVQQFRHSSEPQF